MLQGGGVYIEDSSAVNFQYCGMFLNSATDSVRCRNLFEPFVEHSCMAPFEGSFPESVFAHFVEAGGAGRRVLHQQFDSRCFLHSRCFLRDFLVWQQRIGRQSQ